MTALAEQACQRRSGRASFGWTCPCPPCVGHRAAHADRCGRDSAARQAELDEIAVERAVGGDPPKHMTRAERQAAVAQLARHGLSDSQIAVRLRCSARTVQRLRVPGEGGKLTVVDISLATTPPPDWREAAVCREDPDAWFASGAGVGSVGWAEPILACETRCPVQLECLADALRHEAGRPADERFGIWGGKTPRQRAELDGAGPRPFRKPFATFCPWPGRERGHSRHVALGESICPPCRAYEIERSARQARDARVVELDEAGLTVGQIAVIVAERRDTVRGILARHLREEQSA